MVFPFRKKEIPAELPSLALPDLKKEDAQVEQREPNSYFRDTVKYQPLPQAVDYIKNEQKIASFLKVAEEKNTPDYGAQGYFANLIKDVIENADNMDKLDTVWEANFAESDSIDHMKDYWEKQQPDITLKNMTGELKAKMMEKVDTLHALEKEWQAKYFELREKEEKIKTEEIELKKSLSEFMAICKKAGNKSKVKKQ